MREAWVDFLGRFRWDWFATFTFRDRTHPESAYKRFSFFVGKLNVAIYGRRWAANPWGGIHWCNALEWQRRGVIHFHALLGDTVDLNNNARRLAWMDFWNSIAGFAKIELINSQVSVAAYCSKYVVKGGELDLSRSLAAYGQQERLTGTR